MQKCVFLGLTTVDILNYLPKYPGSNEKVRAEHQLLYAGGPAANAAVACAALGSEAVLVTGLGTTPLAGIARSDLQAHGVEIVDCAEQSRQLPILSTIIVDESCGSRSVVYTATAGRHLTPLDTVEDILQGAAVLMLDGYYLPQAVRFAAVAQQLAIPVVLDGGSWKDGLERLLPFVDYGVCSETFQPPWCSNPAAMISCLAEFGIDSGAISRGGRSLLAWQGAEAREIAVPAVEAVDTLGAGDILHGALCHFLAGRDFCISLEQAVAVASLSCRFRGTREWIGHCRKG